MFTQAVIINMKPGRDFRRTRIQNASARVRYEEGSPAAAHSSAVLAVPLTAGENP